MYPEVSLHAFVIPEEAIICVIVVTGSIVEVEDEEVVEVVLLVSVELGPKYPVDPPEYGLLICGPVFTVTSLLMLLTVTDVVALSVTNIQ